MRLFTTEQKKTIFDILGIQVDEDLHGRMVELARQNDFRYYTTEIKENFDLFDKAIVKVFSPDKKLSETTSFNLILESKKYTCRKATKSST